MQITLDLKRLDLTWLFCLILTLTASSLSPYFRLSFFAPFLVIACYKKPLIACLWFSLLCGLILDLLSSHTRIGIHALTFCITISLLYPQKRNFFADSLSTLPIMTFLFASLSSFIMALLLYSLEMNSMLSWNWILTDLIIMPAADGLYAFCCFILPALLFGKPRRRSKDYFLS
jgi:rod shape-determining protein MreD